MSEALCLFIGETHKADNMNNYKDRLRVSSSSAQVAFSPGCRTSSGRPQNLETTPNS